jgi:hypothetical protein
MTQRCGSVKQACEHALGSRGLVLLADMLRWTGGVYETMPPLLPQLRDNLREVAELTSDPELLAIADLAEVPVSPDQLRGLDPQTRIIIRAEHAPGSLSPWVVAFENRQQIT